MLHKIKEVCKLTDKSKEDIYLLLNDGKLSYVVSKDGKRKIETSELLRVFPNVIIAGINDITKPQVLTEKNEHEMIKQKQEIFELRGMVTDLRSQIDNVLDDNRRLLRLLEHQNEPEPPENHKVSATELAQQGVENYRKARQQEAQATEVGGQASSNVWHKIKNFFFN